MTSLINPSGNIVRQFNLVKPEELVPGYVLPILPARHEDAYKEVEGMNFYRTVTEFYVNAMWGQLPRTSAERDLLQAFTDSTVQRSVNGYGAVLSLDGRHYVPNTRWLFRWEDDGIEKGWIMGWTWRDSTSNYFYDDMIRLFIYEHGKGIIIVKDFEYQGNSLGRMIGESMVPGMAAIWGNGFDDYRPMHDLVDWFNSRLKRNKELLDRLDSPHMQGPAAAKNEQGGVDLDPEGSYLATTPDDGDYSYLTWDSNQPLNEHTLRTFIDMMHYATGVPGTAFGLTTHGGDSGVARERQMFSALSKVRRWRRDVEDALETFGVTDLAWVNDPFMSYKENVESETMLLELGVISVEECRERLGIEGKVSPSMHPHGDMDEDNGDMSDDGEPSAS